MAAPVENMPEETSALCQLEGSVVTGFEEMAQEEIEEMFGVTSTTKRGSVNFVIPIEQANSALKLCCVNNISVIVNTYHDFKFADSEDGCINQVIDLVPKIDWKKGLEVWHKFFKFHQPISHHQQTLPVEVEADDTEGSPPAKKSKNPDLPSFRATCYRSGKHLFQSPKAASEFGGTIQDYFGWNVDLKNHDIEVVLNIESTSMYIGISLTRSSLSNRNITEFGPTTLRPTIAYGMLRYAKIKAGDIVCDPMCGGGSIPIEAAINWPCAHHLCGDLYDLCPSRSRTNHLAVNQKLQDKGKKGINLDTFHWDVTNMPLKEESVDVFITDLPFGKRSGSKVRNWHLYPQILKEMARVCRTSTGRACLLTHDRKCMIKSLEAMRPYWRRGATLGTSIGGLAAAVYMLHRTPNKYTEHPAGEVPEKQKT